MKVLGPKRQEVAGGCRRFRDERHNVHTPLTDP
jgi:hypothetical protein